MSWLAGAMIFWAAAWLANVKLANGPWSGTRAVRLIVPLLFGLTLLILWEGLVRGLSISPVILPACTATRRSAICTISSSWWVTNSTGTPNRAGSAAISGRIAGISSPMIIIALYSKPDNSGTAWRACSPPSMRRV